MEVAIQTPHILLIDDEWCHEMDYIIDIPQQRGLQITWISRIERMEGTVFFGIGSPQTGEKVAVDFSKAQLILADSCLGPYAPTSGREVITSIVQSMPDRITCDGRLPATLVVSISSVTDSWMMNNGTVFSVLKRLLPQVIRDGLSLDQCESIHLDCLDELVGLFNQIIFGERSDG